jgi:hypothetical protein
MPSTASAAIAAAAAAAEAAAAAAAATREKKRKPHRNDEAEQVIRSHQLPSQGVPAIHAFNCKDDFRIQSQRQLQAQAGASCYLPRALCAAACAGARKAQGRNPTLLVEEGGGGGGGGGGVWRWGEVEWKGGGMGFSMLSLYFQTEFH